MDSITSCSIVLPCYNPQPQWVGRIVEQYRAIAARLGVPVSLILVNDGSTTGIGQHDIEILRREIPGFTYIEYTENKGKGYALRQGITRADTDIIIYTDVDFPYSTDSIGAVFDAIHKEGFDVAIGIKNEDYYEKVPKARRFISKMLRTLIGIFFSIPVTDTQCGLKGFKRGVKEVFLTTTIDRYLFDLEFIYKLYKRAFKVKPVQVELNNNVIFRSMNYKILIPEMVNFLKIILR